MQGINYETVCEKNNLFYHYKGEKTMERLFYFLLSHTADMIDMIYQKRPPLDGVILDLEKKFHKVMFNPNTNQRNASFTFVGSSVRYILETLGYQYLDSPQKLQNGTTIKTQSLYRH